MASATISHWIQAKVSSIFFFFPSHPHAVKVNGFPKFTPAAWSPEAFECVMPLSLQNCYCRHDVRDTGGGKKQRTQQNHPEKTSIISISLMRKTGFLFLALALHFLIHLPSEEHVYSPLYYKAYGSGSNERQDKNPFAFLFLCWIHSGAW